MVWCEASFAVCGFMTVMSATDTNTLSLHVALPILVANQEPHPKPDGAALTAIAGARWVRPTADAPSSTAATDARRAQAARTLTATAPPITRRCAASNERRALRACAAREARLGARVRPFFHNRETAMSGTASAP